MDSAENWTQAATRHHIDGPSGTIAAVVAEPALWSDHASTGSGAASDGAPAKGSVLLLHGRNGAPDQPQIAEIARAYLARGWRVIAPELPHSAALPETGPANQVTFSGHTKAAAQIWDWVARQWPAQPRALAGHSLGAFAIAQLATLAAAPHHLLAVSPPLSGRVLYNSRLAMGKAAIDAVRAEAPLFLEEMAEADAGPSLRRSPAPLAVVTGAADGLVRIADARAYFSASPNGRYFGALPEVHHCPSGAECAQMLRAALLAVGA